MRRFVLIAILCVLYAGTAMAATTADVIFVVDESGSMAGEHAWLSNMVTSLDTELTAAGVTGNQYALVGFGKSSNMLHTLTGYTDAAGLSSAATGLVAYGGTEDGYNAINYALTTLGYRSGAAVNVILVTDEDRDVVNSSVTKSSVLALLANAKALLNVVVDAYMYDDAGSRVLGIDAEDNAYKADGSGGYTATAATSPSISGYGTTTADYIQPAWTTGGAAWDLNLLRAGGLTADSFTEAFVDIKVGEIQEQPGVPVPGAVLLGLLGLGVAGRKLRKQA